MDPASRRVIGHATAITLEEVTFIVSQPGRARVLATGRKNVHAFASGTIVTATWTEECGSGGPTLSTPLGAVTYNPRRDTSFVVLPDRMPIIEAERAQFGIQECSPSS
jgi:hypothetical protein